MGRRRRAEVKKAKAAFPFCFPGPQEPLGKCSCGSLGAIPEALRPGDKPVTMGAPLRPASSFPTCTINYNNPEDIQNSCFLSPCHARRGCDPTGHSYQPHGRGAVVTPIFQMSKLRLQESSGPLPKVIRLEQQD